MSHLDYYKAFKNSSIIQDLNNYGKRQNVFVQPSELNLDREVVDFIAYPKGCEIYIKGEAYPMRAHNTGEKVNKVTEVKKMIPIVLKSFNGGIVKKLIALWYFKDNWETYLWYVWYFMRSVYADVDRYNQPTRELYRILKSDIDEKDPNYNITNDIITQIREPLCAIVEYDMAYRYRFQDIVVELDKKKFERNPIKEMCRLLDIMIDRENGSMGMIPKWKNVKFAIWFLRFRPMWLEKIKKIVREINLDEIRSNACDIYWQNSVAYEQYNFRGEVYSERLKAYNKEKENYAKGNLS